MAVPHRVPDSRMDGVFGASLAELVVAVERRGLTVELSEQVAAGVIGDPVPTVYRALVCDPGGGSDPVAAGASPRGHLAALAVAFADLLGRSSSMFQPRWGGWRG